MRVYATAIATDEANAIGRIELECTAGGLALTFFGLGSYSDGYVPGALAKGTRVTLPYPALREATLQEDRLFLHFEARGIPHDRLTLTRFAAGPGVPPHELRQRRLILHTSALGLATLVTLVAIRLTSTQGMWGSLLLGSIAFSLVLLVGYAVDQSFFTRPPSEDITRNAFLADLERFAPGLLRPAQAPLRPRENALRTWLVWLPRSSILIAATIATMALTATVTMRRIFDRGDVVPPRSLSTSAPARSQAPEPPFTIDAPPPIPEPAAPALPSAAPSKDAHDSGKNALFERACICDRADSPLWRDPVPRLSALLLESRSVPRKDHVRTQVDVAVVNNGDEPISAITVHIVFREQGKPDKERPLFFEGPLQPGRAVKWTTEARGDKFTILAPDLGYLGRSGEGAAKVATFVELLDANHRPVRLHAARMLAFLGDARAQAAALALKDAFRTREAPYLRRILAATGELRVCDVEVSITGSSKELEACVYNGSGEVHADLGLVVQSLTHPLDPSQPLANPPEVTWEEKWRVERELKPESGAQIRVPLPPHFQGKTDDVEVMTDRYDLLD